MTGRLIAVVGPSGVGKDTVMEAVAAADPRIVLARRVITRPSAAGGEAFDGVSEAAFDELVAANAFAIHWAAHGLRYGIPRRVEAQLTSGQDVLVNFSRSALQKAHELFASCLVISLTANRDVLAARLAARGRETQEEIARRLAHRAPMPDGIKAHVIDNSGALSDTVRAVCDLLYPVKV